VKTEWLDGALNLGGIETIIYKTSHVTKEIKKEEDSW
jgi:hypothetical protein